MEPETALDLGRQTLITGLTISLPMLIVGLVVGVLVSVLQAVTQVQEMTLTFIPKIVAMAMAAIIFLPWIMSQLLTFATAMFTSSSGP